MDCRGALGSCSRWGAGVPWGRVAERGKTRHGLPRSITHHLALPKTCTPSARNHRRAQLLHGQLPKPRNQVPGVFSTALCMSMKPTSLTCPAFTIWTCCNFPCLSPDLPFERRLFPGHLGKPLLQRGSEVADLTWRTEHFQLIMPECCIVPVLNEVLENDFQM